MLSSKPFQNLLQLRSLGTWKCEEIHTYLEDLINSIRMQTFCLKSTTTPSKDTESNYILRRSQLDSPTLSFVIFKETKISA